MMRFRATRSTAFCAPGARSGGLGSVRVEAIGFRQREQTGARSLTSLPQPGQEIDAILVQRLSRQSPPQGSVSVREGEFVESQELSTSVSRNPLEPLSRLAFHVLWRANLLLVSPRAIGSQRLVTL
jgi:hypothetical protein